jgi:hypothetical protein
MSAKTRLRCNRGVLVFSACFVIVTTLLAANAAYAIKPFGITKFTMETTAPTREVSLGKGEYEFFNDRYTFTQAGGHPWALTSTIEFETETLENLVEKRHFIVPTRDPKNVIVDLPPGLLGNPQAVPRCPLEEVLNRIRCPASTQIGEYKIRWEGGKEMLAPIVNVVPQAGQSAEFAFENEIKITPILTGRLVHTAQGYGFEVVSSHVPLVEISRVETTFWGVPADSSHDPMRGRFCGNTVSGQPLTCNAGAGGLPAEIDPVPFLTMSTDCSTGPETGTLRADSWQEPGHVTTGGQYEGYREATVTMPGVTGCNLLRFDPTIEVQPDTLLADEPVGLGLTLRIPLNERPGSNATPQLRNSVVTLPNGLSVSPGIVDGIQACDEFGQNGINITGPESEEVGTNGELQLAAGHCPEASIVGTAEAFTPLLPVPVKGHLYLARPGCGGPGQAVCTKEDVRDGNLYRLYLELGGTGALANTGVHFKVALQTNVDPVSGRITTSAIGTPQAPFSELKIHLKGGPRAALANPAVCGPAVTTSVFTPWSAPGETFEHIFMPGTADATPSSFFDVNGCADPPGLSPDFMAGTITPQAAKFTSFTLTFARRDREQYIRGIQVRTPPGLLGMLSSVPLCDEEEANAGTCAEASRIGSTRVASGSGSHPFEIGGNVYLTKGYGGAPFGLSIVTRAVAGPFNLGIVVVRARIQVDEDTSTLIVTTDETGQYAIPQVVFGVPLRLQRVTVNIDRPGFMFNPTNCAAQHIYASISGVQNGTAQVSSQFAVGGCRSLAFRPRFTVSTSGHTSRVSGASLDTKVSYPAGSFGNDANIARVKVSLPRQLPSRLSTLQKACPAPTFVRNPATCPRGSVVGVVRASTPVLPTRLSGPVYFVSHGGEAFPSLVIVLQGDGVRVDLTGTTFISKAGITSSTFNSVPDVPVKTFELYLPQGKFSALASPTNLCRHSLARLVMPTEFVGQNGAVIKQKTAIHITGCKTKRTKTVPARGRTGTNGRSG